MKGRSLHSRAERNQCASESRSKPSEVLGPREGVLRLDDGPPRGGLSHKGNSGVCVSGCRKDVFVGDGMGEAAFGSADRCDCLGPLHEVSHPFIGAAAKRDEDACISGRRPKCLPTQAHANDSKLARFRCLFLLRLEDLEDSTHGPKRASPPVGGCRMSRNTLQSNGHPPRCKATCPRSNDDITKVEAGKVVNRERKTWTDRSKPWILQNGIGAGAVLLRGLEQTNDSPAGRWPLRESCADTGKNGHVPVVPAGVRDPLYVRSVRVVALIRNRYGIHVGANQKGRPRGFSLEDPCLAGSSDALEDPGDTECSGRFSEPGCCRPLVPREFGVAV